MRVLVFKPTHRCNLSCPFCYDRVNKTADAEIMPVDKAIFAIQKALDTSPERDIVRQIVWHGGEPTLVGADYIDQVCSHDYGQDIKWAMQTNMSLLDPELKEVLEKHHIELGGSWDGLAQSNTNFHHTCYVHNCMNVMGYANLLYVVTPKNCDDVIPSFLHARENHYNIQFNPVFGENVTPEQYAEMAWKLSALFDLQCLIPDTEITRPFSDIVADIANNRNWFCEEIFCVGRWLCIEPDGSVVNCGHPWPKDLVYGNIFDEDFRVDKLEETPAYKKMKKHLYDQFEHCKDCKWLCVCRNRCPFTTIDPVTHDFKFNEGNCKFRSILSENVYKIIKERASNGTLVNKEVINALNYSVKREFMEWKNYKSPTI